MSYGYRYCRLCFRFMVDPRYLPGCQHSFCLNCIRSYYDQRQRGSVMRIAAFPCPETTCRMLSEVPLGGVRDFPSHLEEKRTDPENPESVRVDPENPESVRVDPEISEAVRESPKKAERKLKKRVTFSDPETPKDDEGPSDSSAPQFRSTVSMMIGRIVHQQQVDIPDSALVLTTPAASTGSDVMEEKASERNRFFPPVTSLEPEPEMNGIEVVGRTDSSVVVNDMELVAVGKVETNNRFFPAENNNLSTPSQSQDVPSADTTMGSPVETLASGVTLSWRVTKNAHHKPTSIALTPQGQAIIADYGKGTLDYVDDTGQTTFSVNSLKPFAVLLTTSGSVVVVGDRKSKTLVFLEAPPSTEVVSRWESGSFEWVGGIGSLRNGNLVVSDRANCRIGVYTPEGRRILEFGSYGTGDDNICMADFLTVDSKDRIIVSDSANHCVKVFDAQGRSLTRFCGRGSADGRLAWPKGVCVDRLDNIIVADSKNGRLSRFSTSGDFIEHVVSGVRNPFGVCHQADSDMIGVTYYSLAGYSQCDVYRLNQET